MKKNTLLLFFMIVCAATNYAQCTFTTQAPLSTIVSNNSGSTQTISSFTFAKNYAKVSNLIVGGKYIFNCTAGSVNNYVTVTDLSNNVIAFGPSPLTVASITSSDIKVHYYETADCGTNWSTLTVSFQYVLPNCPSSTNIMVSNITTTNATFSWIPGADDVTAWEVLVLESSAPAPTPATSGIAVTASTYTATTLLPSTQYKFYVRSNCGSEFGTWGTALNFATVCTPVTAFSENFDATSIMTLPICWSSIINGTEISQYAYIATEDFDAYSGTHAVQLFKFDSSEDSNFILVSPNLTNLSSGTHRLKFYARNNGPANIQVGTITNPTNSATFTTFEDIALTDNYVEYTVNFSTYTGTNTYIAIRLDSGTSVFLDDIRWEANPVCADVFDIISSTTATTANIFWETGGTETQWDVVIGSATATNPDLLTPISPAPSIPGITITNLTPNTAYTVWVRSVCGGANGNGAWIGPISFTTDCVAVAQFNQNFDSTSIPYLPTCWTGVLSGSTLSSSATIETADINSFSGSNAVMLDNHSSGPEANIMLVSPNLSTLSSANHQLKFYARALSNSGLGKIEVGTLDSNGTFTILVDPITITDQYVEYVIDFTSYSGTDTHIGLRNTSDMYTAIFMDNIRWELVPVCADVTGITVSAITTTTATVAWQVEGTESSWQVVYGDASVTDPATLTPSALLNDPTFVLNGLTANNAYNVWVRSNCTAGNGNWIGPVTFNAACSAVPSLNENFDTTANEALPGCWSAILSGATLDPDAYAQTVDYYGHSGTNSMRINNYTSGPDDTVMLVSPNLSTLGTAGYSLKFYGKSDDGSATVIIGTLNGNNSSATFTPIQQIELTTTYSEFTVDFSNVGTDTYIGFKNANLATYSPVTLDDIRWENNLKTNQFDETQFSFYPNPSSNVVNIRLNSAMDSMESVVLYDLVGKSVLKIANVNSNQSTINVSALAKGMYLAEITTKNQLKITRKLIVK